jgi:hypothetical protein
MADRQPDPHRTDPQTFVAELRELRAELLMWQRIPKQEGALRIQAFGPDHDRRVADDSYTEDEWRIFSEGDAKIAALRGHLRQSISGASYRAFVMAKALGLAEWSEPLWNLHIESADGSENHLRTRPLESAREALQSIHRLMAEAEGLAAPLLGGAVASRGEQDSGDDDQSVSAAERAEGLSTDQRRILEHVVAQGPVGTSQIPKVHRNRVPRILEGMQDLIGRDKSMGRYQNLVATKFGRAVARYL